MKKILIALIIVGMGVVSCKKGDIRGIGGDLGTTGSYLTMVQKIKTSIDPDHKTTDVASIIVGYRGTTVASIKVYVVKDQNTDSTSWTYIKTIPYPSTGNPTLTITAQEIADALYAGDLDQLLPGDIYTIYNMIITTDGRHFSSANTASSFESEPAYNMALHWGIVLACPIDTPEKVCQYLSGDFKVIKDEWDDFNPTNPANSTVTLFCQTTLPPDAGFTLNDNQFAMLMYPSPTPDYPPGSTAADRQYMIATIASDGLAITVNTSAPDKKYVGTYHYTDNTTETLGLISTGEISSCNGKGKVTLSNSFLLPGSPPTGYCCYEAIIVQQ